MKVGNPFGLGLIILGAIAMAIAAFLPFAEPIGPFARVMNNTLIQHGGGWLLIAAALGIAASGYRVSQGRRKERWGPIVLCVIAAGLIVLNANDKSLRTLYPVRPDGIVDTSQPGMVASLGIAIYVAGAGVAAAFIGSLMLLQREDEKPPPAPAVKPKPPPGVLAPGAPVKVVAAGDEHEGQVGVVQELVNEDGDGLDVCVKFNGDTEVYAFSRDELSVVVPRPNG